MRLGEVHTPASACSSTQPPRALPFRKASRVADGEHLGERRACGDDDLEQSRGSLRVEAARLGAVEPVDDLKPVRPGLGPRARRHRLARHQIAALHDENVMRNAA